MKKIINPILAIMFIALIAVSCKKDNILIIPESSKELRVINYDSSKFGGYVNCGIAGRVDGSGITFQCIAPSEKGQITITNFVYHIDVNDLSSPYTTISMYDGYTGALRDIEVNGSDVEFSHMRCVVPEGDNGRYFGAGLTYSGIGRNHVVSGKTVSSITLTSLTYVDRDGHTKTVHPNLKSADRMSVYSFMWLNPQYFANSSNTLNLGQVKIFEHAFSSVGGDHLLKEIPLKIKTVDCSLGTAPQISITINDGSNTGPFPILPATVVKIDDSIYIVKLPQGVVVPKDKMVSIGFFAQVQSMTITSNTKLRTSLCNLKYLKYIELATGTEFSAQNEFFMWMTYYYSPYNIEQYYLELYP